jgi:transposase
MILCLGKREANMPRPLSIDLRSRIVKTYQSTLLSQEEVAERFQVGVASVVRLIAKSKRGSSLEPQKFGPRGLKKKISGQVLDTLRSIVEAQPDLTNAEFMDELEKASGIKTSTASISRALNQMGFTRKKNTLRHGKGKPKSAGPLQLVS